MAWNIFLFWNFWNPMKWRLYEDMYSYKTLYLRLDFSVLKIRHYYEKTLEELKERHIREVESIKAQQRVQFDRDGTHAYSRFSISNRLPYSSYESDDNGMDAQRYVVKINYQ